MIRTGYFCRLVNNTYGLNPQLPEMFLIFTIIQCFHVHIKIARISGTSCKKLEFFQVIRVLKVCKYKSSYKFIPVLASKIFQADILKIDETEAA